MNIAEEIINKMQSLPEDQQREVLALVEKLARSTNDKRTRSDPYGVLSEHPSNMTLEDFQRSRQEMWSHFPREFSLEGN